MTVEELRRSYTKETGNTFYKVSFNTNLAFDYTKYSYQYVDWLEQKLTQPCPDVCWWRYQEDLNSEYYDTSCENAQCFTVGDLVENQYKFCPYCGKPIKLME